MSWYPWVVVAHVFAVIVAFMAHGVSAFAMYRARQEPDRARLAAVLDLSSWSLTGAGIVLLIAIGTGLLAAWMGGHFSRWWPWVSIVVIVVVAGLMTPVASTPLMRVRRALGQRTRGDKATDPPPEPATDQELASVQARLHPNATALLGLAGLAILVWLMELKPF